MLFYLTQVIIFLATEIGALGFILCSICLLFSAGSMFLFDRKALRYFRKDGHRWRKKKDGKTVREAHEKLKVCSSIC
jgi:hypothetical protein